MNTFTKYGDLKGNVFEKKIFVPDGKRSAKVIGLELYTAKILKNYPYVYTSAHSNYHKKMKNIKSYY